MVVSYFLLAYVNCFYTRTKSNLPITSVILRSQSPADRDIGYGPVGSLLRQGPVPFFIRITKPDTYNASVEKYMKLEKCDRMTAQGNMDAYFQDPSEFYVLRLSFTPSKIFIIN